MLIKEQINAISKGKASFMYEQAKQISNGQVDELADAVISIGNAQYIFYFACDIKNAPIDKLADAVIITGNALYICLFAGCVKNAPIDKLTDAIIKNNSAHYIYWFAKIVKNAPIDKLEATIMKTDSIEYKLQFKYFIKEELEIPNTYAFDILQNKIDKREELNYLIKNRNIDNNEIKLRIYFDLLSNSEENIDMEYAYKCDLEYINYLSEQKEEEKTYKKMLE